MGLTIKMQLMLEASDKILEIVDNADEFTRGDLQGAIEAQMMILIATTKKLVEENKL